MGGDEHGGKQRCTPGSQLRGSPSPLEFRSAFKYSHTSMNGIQTVVDSRRIRSGAQEGGARVTPIVMSSGTRPTPQPCQSVCPLMVGAMVSDTMDLKKHGARISDQNTLKYTKNT